VAVRIYAFAKELGVDNKKLLEICEKAGIKNKGSALASLSDDEVEKLKKHLAEGTKDKKSGTSAAPSAAAKSAPPSRAATVSPAAPRQPQAPSRDPIARKKTGPVRDLSARNRRSARDASGDSGGHQTDRPTGDRPKDQPADRGAPRKPAVKVKFASVPDVKQPQPSASKPAEKVQKPDMALPKQAIRDAMIKASKTEQADAKTKETRKTKTKRDSKATELPFDPADLPAVPAGDSPLSGRRKDRKPKKGERGHDEPVPSLGSTRQARRPNRHRQISMDENAPVSYARRRQQRRRSGPVANTAAPRKETVTLELPCTVRSFSEATGVSSGQVLKVLMQLGTMVNINAEIDMETAEFVAAELDLDIKFREQESLEESLINQIEQAVEDDTELEPRPPVVTFLGHVDHGKTSLLDSIIGIDVVSGEAGGITQHIRAYQIEKNNQRIAFVDTPGHEAFTEMRARGANVTDIAVLVVAADDGVMPQTEEAISHIKAAGVPIIVALNKMDLPGANPDKALQDLAAHELLPSEWGGDIEVVRTSATSGDGLDELLETILLTAELHEYQANSHRPAVGNCLESEQESGRGVIAKLLVRTGTLRVGDVVVCGAAHGRIKAIYDTLHPDQTLAEVGPSTPVNVTGLDMAPDAGDRFYVLDDISDAREIAAARAERGRTQSLAGITKRISFADFQERLESGSLVDERDVVELNLIIRADVRGSIEAIQKEISKIDHPEVSIRILQALVGGITPADVRLAQASHAVIVGFNVVPDEVARSLADELQVEIRRYDVIYKVTDDIRATLEGQLKPEKHSVDLGTAMVLQTFNISRVGTIAGCRVMRGTIERNCRIRVIRDSRVLGDYPLDSLKREKDDAKEVQRGMECGIRLAGFNDIKEGDTLEAYKIEEVARTLE